MAEIIGSLLKQNLPLLAFEEFDFLPYNCFKHMEKIAERKYRIRHLGDKIPMVYALVAQKKG
jgi:hypothetical protein